MKLKKKINKLNDNVKQSDDNYGKKSVISEVKESLIKSQNIKWEKISQNEIKL